MMPFHRARRAPPSRRAAEFAFPAPSKGLVRAGPLLMPSPGGPDMAEVLDNWIPTAQGARIRGGATLHATLGAPVEALFSRRGGADLLFAATEHAIFDLTTVDDAEVVPVPAVSGLLSGDWSTVQFATAGGEFLVCVNGADPMHRFDGGGWNPVGATAVNDVPFDALTAPFAVGETVTGGTSGATATILSICPASATAGTLKVGPITGGPFQNNEALTSSTGAATANGASSAATTTTITGVATSDLIATWTHMRRLWFVEKATLSAWYLGINSIAGPATEFPLGGVFRFGGALLFGGSVSMDAGDGMDDYLVAVTTEGEVAVYQGVDPDTDFALVGIYRISRPLGKRCWFRQGGDLLVMTEDGIVSLTMAMQGDPGTVLAASVTAPIEALWSENVAQRAGDATFSCAAWTVRGLALVGVPDAAGDAGALVLNTRTGAWATISGWPAVAFEVWRDRLYFATATGLVAEGDTGGTDMGVSFTARYLPKFSEFATTGEKAALSARFIWRGDTAARPALDCFADYTLRDFPGTGSIGESDTGVWGESVWGEFTWGAAVARDVASSEWHSVAGVGFALAPAVALTVNNLSAPACEIVATVLRYEVGASM